MITRKEFIATVPAAILTQSFSTNQDERAGQERDEGLHSDAWVPWQAVDLTLAQIALLPEWPHDRDFREEEWQQMIAQAVSWQNSRPCTVETIMVAAMLVTQFYRPPAGSDDDHWLNNKIGRGSLGDQIGSKLMILLRLMFDIPPDAEGIHLPASGFSIRGCGGYPSHAADGGAELFASKLSSPVSWEEKGPKLTRWSALDEPGGIAVDYQPQIEYRYLQETYPLRKSLARAVAAGTYVPHAMR